MCHIYLNPGIYFSGAVMSWHLSVGRTIKISVLDCIHVCNSGNAFVLTKHGSVVRLTGQEYDYLLLKLISPDKGCYYSYDECRGVDRQLEVTSGVTQRWWKGSSLVHESRIFLTQDESDSLIYISNFVRELIQ
jgi:hypothetical protein